ncbi:high affinity copper uptake protein 1-like isoform X3 [Cotesia glomerata]|uniref:high affinity copper uptake protein 1-like isoform X3 n=1 Tax=Cotesia glomerata TaxID=32391 RepID=UPI001D0031C1|nr:high affinity copper uptake protein 1-like isoform X3 [Cotesia glomerata]
MMAMFFHFGVKESAILFSGWKTNDWQGVLGSCIGIFILGVIYEGLKSYRESMFLKLSYFYRNQKSRRTLRKLSSTEQTIDLQASGHTLTNKMDTKLLIDTRDR